MDSCDPTDGCLHDDIPDCGGGAPTWSADIQPIVAQKCSGCHIGGSSGGLNMSSLAFKDQPSGKCAGKTRGEAIALKIRPDVDAFCSGTRMPPSGPFLSAEIQQLFADWVAGGMQE